MASMKIAVTGGTGFIGSHIVQELISGGHEVAVLSRDAKQSSLQNVELLECDILDMEKLISLTKNFGCIIHLAGLRSTKESITKPFEYNKINIDGTVNVLESARVNSIPKVIFASSSSVYGNTHAPKKKELETLRPSSPYGVSKLAAENYCSIYSENFGIETVSLRMFNVYGPMQEPNGGVIASFIDSTLKNQKPVIFGSGKQLRDFIYISDVARAFTLAIKNSKKCNGTAINIASGKGHTLLQVLKIIEQLEEKKISTIMNNKFLGDVDTLIANINLAKKKLEWKPKHSLRAGIKETLEWAKKLKYFELITP